MKLGVMGGTFDPVHTGHLIAAEVARVKLELDTILFVPAGRPWLKTGRFITPAAHRVQMVRLATESNPFFALSMAEVERPGPSYTVDTMREMRNRYGSEVELVFILGSDNMPGLQKWKDIEELLRLCSLAVMRRAGSRPPEQRERERLLSGKRGKIIFVDMPVIGISSSDIRERVRKGLSVRYMVADAVERYIVEENLYRCQ
jgi:nicotinate-nucleotide adenylyltransferase